MSSLMQRVITACALAAAFLLALFFLPATAFLIFITLGILLGAWEWAAFLGNSAPPRRLLYVAAMALLMALLWLSADYDRIFSAVMLAAVCWWALALILLTRYPVAIAPLPAALCGVLTLLPVWYGISYIINELNEGSKVLFVVLLIVAAADIGAYFAGRAFGRNKLAPKISPGKTVEGLAGGLLASMGGASLGAFLLNWPLNSLLALGLAVGVISVIGDLTVSMFKRNAGIKDSGSLFPGHGGILDRVDSIAAAIPVFVLGIGWLGLLESV